MVCFHSNHERNRNENKIQAASLKRLERTPVFLAEVRTGAQRSKSKFGRYKVQMGKIQKLCCCCCWNDCLSRSADGENGRESRKSRRARVDRFTSPDWSERLLSTVSKCFWASLDSYFNSQQYLTVSLKSLSAFVGCLRLQLLMLRPRASIRMGQLTSCRSLSSAAFSLYTHTRILSVCVCVCV